MSDRPTGTNGKRSQDWGSTAACPACGRCLCFGCHPEGPCVDEHEAAAAGARQEHHPVGASRTAWAKTHAVHAA